MQKVAGTATLNLQKCNLCSLCSLSDPCRLRSPGLQRLQDYADYEATALGDSEGTVSAFCFCHRKPVCLLRQHSTVF